MGLTRISASEIITNPRDLQLMIPEKDGKFAWVITRGPGHRYKPIVDTDDYCFNTLETAIKSIIEILEIALQDTLTQLRDKTSFLAAVANPDGKPENEWIILNTACCQKIAEVLKEKRTVSTWKLFTENDPIFRQVEAA